MTTQTITPAPAAVPAYAPCDSPVLGGAQVVVKTLLDAGVELVFGYPGGAIMPLYDALFDGGLKHILCRHEQGASLAADGYARATGKVGVCMATSGPGATNLVTGIAPSANAWKVWDSISFAPDIKIDAVRKLGAEVIIHGDNFDEACAHALALAGAQKRTFIHPYDDPEVICGQGTLGPELLRQSGGKLDYVFLPVGGGGLAAGVALVLKYLQPSIRIIGVEAVESASMQAAISASKPINLPEMGHFAEGVAVRKTGDLTFAICRELIDDFINVDSDEICAAIQDIYEDTRAIAEPAGAVALAGIRKYFTKRPAAGVREATAPVVTTRVATVLSGANVNFARLRHIVERAAVGEESEVLLAVTIPEKPDSFLRFCEVVGQRNITEFNYRYADNSEAHIFVGIELKNAMQEKSAILDKLAGEGFPVTDLSSNDMARLHIRHMVGGRANVPHERVIRFQFPERPGALLAFLRGIQSDWNISLFHYRNYGSEYGRILMGIQVPDEDMLRFQHLLHKTGYSYRFESDNEAFRLFVA